jgi:hypothetical protein
LYKKTKLKQKKCKFIFKNKQNINMILYCITYLLSSAFFSYFHLFIIHNNTFHFETNKQKIQNNNNDNSIQISIVYSIEPYIYSFNV